MTALCTSSDQRLNRNLLKLIRSVETAQDELAMADSLAKKHNIATLPSLTNAFNRYATAVLDLVRVAPQLCATSTAESLESTNVLVALIDRARVDFVTSLERQMNYFPRREPAPKTSNNPNWTEQNNGRTTQNSNHHSATEPPG